MFGKFLKKIIGKSDKKETADSKKPSALKEKSEKISNFIAEKFDQISEEFAVIKDKTKNLQETNYNLGMKHLQNDNLSEAIFRFRFTIKLWPNCFDAYYQLAYCLVLNDKLFDAKIILVELLAKKPDYDSKAKELLDLINQGLEQLNSDEHSS
jgi:tetratricopeptide (TPR) repeat protein